MPIFKPRPQGSLTSIQGKNREILIQMGYRESSKKRGVFKRCADSFAFYVDMRYHDPVGKIREGILVNQPLVWGNFNTETPDWLRRCLERGEREKLRVAGCDVSQKNVNTYAADGYCKRCNNEFHAGGSYCPCCRRVILALTIKNRPCCNACGLKILEGWTYEEAIKMFGMDPTKGPLVHHHLSYTNDKTIIVCASCHSKIHHSRSPEYAEFKPIDKRPRYKNSYYGWCRRCGRKAKLPPGGIGTLCHRCKPPIITKQRLQRKRRKVMPRINIPFK